MKIDEIIEKCQEKVDLVAKGWDEEDCFLSYEYMVDALHYLKEYQGYLIGKEISEAFDEAFTEMYNKNVDANQEKPHGDD